VNWRATRSSCTGSPACRLRLRFLLNTEQIRCCEHSLATLFSPAVMPRAGSSSAMNLYPSAGLCVDIEGGVDQVHFVPVSVRHRVGASGIERLTCRWTALRP
jgi:hypothetical protein